MCLQRESNFQIIIECSYTICCDILRKNLNGYCIINKIHFTPKWPNFMLQYRIGYKEYPIQIIDN